MKRFLSIFMMAMILSPLFAVSIEIKRNDTENVERVEHKCYWVDFRPDYGVADLAYFRFDKSMSRCSISSKRPSFKTYISQKLRKSFTHKDYTGSGYDRGHLVPADAFSSNYSNWLETFSVENIAPQRPEFNQRVWKYLEQQIEVYADRYDYVLCLTGSIIKGNRSTIASGKIIVPEYFYKIYVCCRNDETFDVFVWILPNANLDEYKIKGGYDLRKFESNLYEIYSKTGINILVIPD